MSLFNLFKKKEKKVEKKVEPFEKEKVDSIIQYIKENYSKPVYRIQNTEDNSLSIFDSKFGGSPYWDTTLEYPKDSKGNQLILLAQINLEKENFELLITGNPQMALLLLKLFCKRIYDQKRRFRILVVKDLQARLADVFMLLDEMNPMSNQAEKQRRFNVTISDVSHWAGLAPETTRDELNKLVEKRKIEIYDTYIIVNNINDLKRMYETRSGVTRV